ncbi:MAG: DUF2764 family protein [Candidatus Gastranaerophilaceae bacterium]|jgi:V/A-type H+-transporting ATPase subunit C|nr:DUF2764 family protein [Christensenellales bacterium]
MQDSTIYAVARIRTLEKGLLSAERIKRMAQGSLDDAMRLLIETGYGSMPEATADDLDTLIKNELDRMRAVIQEVTPDKALTDVFLMRADVTNLKTLIKLRLMDELNTAADNVSDIGTYDTERLAQMVADKNYSELPEQFSGELNALEERLDARVNPRDISTTLDRAYYRYALSFKNPFVNAYFGASADFTNVLTLLRLRRNGEGAKALEPALLPGGEIALERLLKYFDAPVDAIARSIGGGAARDSIAAALEETIRSGDLSAVSKHRDSYLMRMIRAHKWETESILPVIGYMLAREQEAQAVRIVITLKRNGFTQDDILERLRELYV